MRKSIRCPSGQMGWTSSLHENYDNSFEQFEAGKLLHEPMDFSGVVMVDVATLAALGETARAALDDEALLVTVPEAGVQCL